MKFLLVFLAILACVSAPARTAQKKRFALYGMLLETLPVDLADGAQWMMDKGDTFPVIMFKVQTYIDTRSDQWKKRATTPPGKP